LAGFVVGEAAAAAAGLPGATGVSTTPASSGEEADDEPAFAAVAFCLAAADSTAAAGVFNPALAIAAAARVRLSLYSQKLPPSASITATTTTSSRLSGRREDFDMENLRVLGECT
jgi:hypothetical protein